MDESVYSPGPTAGTLRTAAGAVVTPPADWVLLPPGDAALTRRVKAAGDHWLVTEKRGRRVFSQGLWAPAAIVDRIAAELQVERATPAYAKRRQADSARREKVQDAYVEDFTAAVHTFLAFHPRYGELAVRLAKLVADHATPVGSGTVARTSRIPVEQRAEAAVIAWMRHQTTGYDSMVIPRIKGKRREVRRMLARRSQELLNHYRKGQSPGDDCPLQRIGTGDQRLVHPNKASPLKALVKRERKPGLWLEEVPEPTMGINDILIEVLDTGICGTDLHIYNWDAWASKTIPVPMVVGHEFVGRILEVGSNVNDFRPGEIVSGEGHVVCGRCRNCMAGRRHLCAETQGVGVNRPGAFAERIVLPMTNVWHHDPSLPREVQAIFDPLGNAVHSALSFPVLGEDVLITGAGPIGAMAVAVVRHAGARFVVVTDVNPYRLRLAQSMGATRAVDVRSEDLADVQKQLGMTEGFDIGLEMSGNPTAFRQMLANMSHGGKIAMLGIPEQEMSIDWTSVVFNMLTIKGIYGREMYETWYKMTVMLQSGLNISPVITHRMEFTDYEQGFAAMKSGNCGKVILHWAD